MKPESFSLHGHRSERAGGSRAEAEARRIATEEAQEPFDLASGPLFRASVLRLGSEDYVLLCTMHHIVSDGWSMGILIRELTALYEAFTNSQPSPLAELTIQYADFAQWQRAWLQGEVLDGQLAYWKQQLAGAPAWLELPTDYQRPAVQSFRGAQQPVNLSAALTRELKELSQRAGVTMFMTLLAGWQLLLARYSGQEDIVVGTAIANRNRAETEAVDRVLREHAGAADGTVVATRVSLSCWRGCGKWRWARTRIRTCRLRSWWKSSAGRATRAGRRCSRRMLLLQNVPQEETRVAGLELSALAGEGTTAKYELTLALTETSAGLAGTVGYNTDLFAGGTIERMLKHFEVVLETMVRSPEQRLSELELVSAARAKAVAGGVERDGGGVCRRAGSARVVRRAGGADACGRGGGLPRRRGHLCRAERAREPAGPLLTKPWEWDQRCWWGSAWSGRWRCWWGCWGY